MRDRLIGAALLVLCIAVIALASQGTTPEEQDITVVLLLAPIGLAQLLGIQNWAKKRTAPGLDNWKSGSYTTPLGNRPIIAWASPVFKGVSRYGK